MKSCDVFKMKVYCSRKKRRRNRQNRCHDNICV